MPITFLTYVPIYAFVLSVMVLAWKAYEYIAIRKSQLRGDQFEQFHKIILLISRGKDEKGAELSHASSLAYISELQNFPDYKKTIELVLFSLLKDWKKANFNKFDEVKETALITFKKLKIALPIEHSF